MNSQILELGISVLLLFLGRKPFWLFAGVVGFLWGFQIGSQLLPANSQIAVLAAALVLGLIGAVLAIFVQHLVVILAGFLAGGHQVIHVLTNLGRLFVTGQRQQFSQHAMRPSFEFLGRESHKSVAGFI